MNPLYDINTYDYQLPSRLIAQSPVAKRDESKLLVVHCKSGQLEDRTFGSVIDYFKPGDLLVVNDTKVFPARLYGKKETGGMAELFLLEYPKTGLKNCEIDGATWHTMEVVCLIKTSKRPKPGVKLIFGPLLKGVVIEIFRGGNVKVELYFKGEFAAVLKEYGTVPLPPYIARKDGELPLDRSRYQTIYAKESGAVAAPTAGLHFTDELLNSFRRNGVQVAGVTLHVGYGTFSPVRVDDIREHAIHQEYVVVTEETAGLINETARRGGSIWVVGTTTLRALEFAADKKGRVQPVADWCGIYIYPGYEFRMTAKLITNFHLPRSSLLFLVSALAGQERIMQAYHHAVENEYRFYSYGDAMLLLDNG
jgi:S-adenosylmethionine:tRNA ribosyltransferase-isomerase